MKWRQFIVYGTMEQTKRSIWMDSIMKNMEQSKNEPQWNEKKNKN